MNQEHMRSWADLFIRTGFYFRKIEDGCDFSWETRENNDYLCKLLEEVGCADCFTQRCFRPRHDLFREGLWYAAWEKLHRGAEGSPSPGFRNIPMAIMDTYMAGVVKWINFIGIYTGTSCDGHGLKPHYINSIDGQKQEFLNRHLARITGCTWLHRGRRFLVLRQRRRMPAGREQLPDLAEILYRHKDELRTAFHAEFPDHPSAREWIPGVAKSVQ